MGYRSDVAYIIEFKSFDDRDAYITLMLAKNDERLTRIIEEEINHEDKDRPIATFKAESYKWYREYPEVQAHESLFRQAHDLYGADYRFISIGEDGLEDYEGEDNFADLRDDLYSVHKLETSF
jgi:hypothetical protein